MIASSYDVIVVGAGLAGSVAAREMAKCGVKTLLVERKPVVGYPQRCGGASRQQFIEPYATIREEWVAHRVQQAVLHAPDGTPVRLASDTEYGLLLHRDRMDHDLANEAVEAGAELATGTVVTGLTMENERVTGVHLRTDDSGEITVSSKLVIGADGIDSQVGRWAGLHGPLSNDELANTWFFIADNVDIDELAPHFYWGSRIAPYGYAWVFPLGYRKANIGLGVLASRNAPGKTRRMAETFLRKLFPDANILEQHAGGVPQAPPLKEPYKEGLLLAGDAAWHCAPLTGAGIGTALEAGYLAGQYAAKAINSNTNSTEYYAQYAAAIRNSFGKTHDRLRRMRDASLEQKDEKLNKLARRIQKIPMEKRTFIGIVIRAFLTNPGYLLNAIPALRTY